MVISGCSTFLQSSWSTQHVQRCHRGTSLVPKGTERFFKAVLGVFDIQALRGSGPVCQ